jgi:hypothetical protein
MPTENLTTVPEYEIEPVFITEKEAAKITRRAVQSLRNDRNLGRGLTYYKHGRSVRYFKPEIYRHMLQCRIVPSRKA